MHKPHLFIYGIELCQEVSNHVKALEARLASLSGESNDPGKTKCITELDSTLHDVLDTVLAEAMAREIVHESYQPKLERVDLRNALNSGSSIQDEVRFPIHISPENTPLLSMDPQLLKYVHRMCQMHASMGRRVARSLLRFTTLKEKVNLIWM